MSVPLAMQGIHVIVAFLMLWLITRKITSMLRIAVGFLIATATTVFLAVYGIYTDRWILQPDVLGMAFLGSLGLAAVSAATFGVNKREAEAELRLLQRRTILIGVGVLLLTFHAFLLSAVLGTVMLWLTVATANFLLFAHCVDKGEWVVHINVNPYILLANMLFAIALAIVVTITALTTLGG